MEHAKDRRHTHSTEPAPDGAGGAPERRGADRRHGERRETLDLGGRRYQADRRQADRRLRLAGAGLLATLAFAVGGQHVLSKAGSAPSAQDGAPGEPGDEPSASVDVDTDFRLPSLDRAALEPIIQEAALVNGLPPDLIRAVIQTESHFNPMAVSRVGAQGLMQIMPETARHVGVENPFDPRENVLGGTKYLSTLLDRFKGNTARALAAYNAGPTAVARHRGLPPYRETQGYVRKIQKLVDNTDAEFSIPAASRAQKASLRSHRASRRKAVSGRAMRGRPAVRKASATRPPVVKRTSLAPGASPPSLARKA